jgi:hypothetical protein
MLSHSMGKRHSLRPVCAQPGRHPLRPTLKGYFYTNLGGTLDTVTYANADLTETINVFKQYGVRLLTPDEISKEMPDYPLEPFPS